ncbi:MAG: hypothetical protein VZQ98_04540 [Bacteroidales bacterium]|nr:hypothetical protein [Bacteroidales bacterium]
MDQPHLHTPSDELSDQCQKRFLLTAHLHIEVFYIGGANPKRVLHGLDAGEEGGVVGGVGDVVEHECFSVVCTFTLNTIRNLIFYSLYL